MSRAGRICLLLLCNWAAATRGSDLDDIGVTLLRQVDPSLKGDGVRVAQPEATSGSGDFEVNPAAVGQPESLFTYISTLGTAATFPNGVGLESGHANGVGANFYGLTTGAAPEVLHVDNYDASHFYNQYIAPGASIPARVVSQSFAFGTNYQTMVDTAYDNYAATHGTIFVSVVGNLGPIFPPGTCYNGIGVSISMLPSSIGPTPDGRCKPDLTAPDAAQAPSSANSYSAPYVSGCAAILLQAAARGDGGANTNAAADQRTIKALLINGAIKPSGWTNGISTPLDSHYGSGLVNVFNSWNQMKGGKS